MSIFPGPQPGGTGGGGTATATPFKSDSVTVGNTKTTLQLPGLDLNTDKRYQISGSITQDGSGSTDYYLRANGVATNLATLRNRTVDGSSFAFDLDVEYHRTKGGTIYAAIFYRSDDAPSNAPVYTGAISNLTSIEIVASTANRIGQYSYVDLWRMVGVGEQGPEGPEGPAGADGAGAIDASSVWYTGVAARGGTNTLVLRWSTNTQTIGTGVTYSASAANGDSFTIVETGQYMILTGFYATTAYEACLHIGDSIVNSVAFDAATVVDFALINTNQYLNGPSFCGQIQAGKKVWVTTGAAPYNVYPGKNRIQIMRIG